MKLLRSLKSYLLLIACFSFLALPSSISAQDPCAPGDIAENGGFEDWGVGPNDILFVGNSNGWTSENFGVLEVWGTGFGGVPSYEGGAFLELNSHGYDNVYQDLSTVPGSTYNWSVAHRGRFGVDGADLEFGPPGGPYTVVQSMSDGTDGWGVYSGSYTVPAGQTTTRARFVAVSDGGGCGSCANFLDGFTFSVGDSDCDGVSDACDLCPGGDDGVDNDGDGNPDCNELPAMGDIIEAWTCGEYKVYMAHHDEEGLCHTICISYNAAQAHLDHGDYLGPCGSSDCAQALFSIPGGSATDDATFEAYPNPANTEINILLDSHIAGEMIHIYDQLGRVVWSKAAGEGKQIYRVDISGSQFGNGMYFIHVSGNESIAVQRILISK